MKRMDHGGLFTGNIALLAIGRCIIDLGNFSLKKYGSHLK